MMPFVQKIDGKVIGVFKVAQPGYAEEELPEDHPDVQTFLNPQNTPQFKILDIEQKNPITHRALREFLLGFGEAHPAFKATLLYIRVKAADDAIKVERAKL